MITFDARFDTTLPGGDGEVDISALLEAAGQLGESQAKARIEAGGPGPDGTDWPDWSPRYAATRKEGHSLLRGEGNLLDDIAARPPQGDSVSWGSGLVYAGVHQDGNEDMGIPARPYLGVSAEDAREFEEIGLAHLAQAAGL